MCSGMAQVDFADVGGHVQPHERKSRYGMLEPRVNSAFVADYLHLDAPRNDDRDASAAAVDVEVDEVVVELGLGEVDQDTSEVGADMCLPGDLPSPLKPEPSDAALDLQGLSQSPFGAGERDWGGQRSDDLCESGFGAGGKHSGNAGVQLPRVNVTGRVQVLEELHGAALGTVLAHDLALGVGGSENSVDQATNPLSARILVMRAR
jgi:hypothetical protein